MKKFKTLKAMMMALCVGLAFASCSSSNDDPTTPGGGEKKETVDFAKTIAGSYTNKLEMTVMQQDFLYKNVTVVLDRVDSTHVDITLPACGSGAMALPALKVEKVEVTDNKGEYKFAVTNYSGTVTANGASKNYTLTLSGAYKDGVVTLDYSLQYGKMPQAMVAKFDSSAKLTPAEAVAGTYTSDLKITVMGQEYTYKDVNLVIEKESSYKVKVTLPACGEGAMAVPALEIPDVNVDNPSGVTPDYVFSKENYTGKVTVGDEEKTFTLDLLSGTLLADGVLSVNYSLQYGNMPQAMIGEFTTKK